LAKSMAAGFVVPALTGLRGRAAPELAYRRMARNFLTSPRRRTLCRLKAGLQTFHRSLLNRYAGFTSSFHGTDEAQDME